MAYIPSDALVYNGHRYYLYSDKDFMWKEAKTYCESLGGHLVTITDENEQTLVEKLIENNASKGNYWLGGYNNNYSSWKWVTGEKFDFTNWYSGEPNNIPDSKENSLSCYTESYRIGKWNDSPADCEDCGGILGSFFYKNNFGFICEWEPEENDWTFKGTTAKYGTSDKTLVTVKGVKSLDGLSISGKIVTIAATSLNKKKVTISGDGYTLNLADGVRAPATKKAAWTLKDTTATYKSSYKTAGYSLANDGKSITYSKATTATTLATVKGVKSIDGLSVKNKVVTVVASSLNKKKVTITSDEGYTLKLADGLAPSTKKAAWNLDGTTATYKSSYKTAGYTLAKNSKSITYSKATTASGLATITGAKSTSGLSVSSKKITLKKSALNSKVTVSGSGYDFNFASDYKKATITGSKNADIITTNGTKLSVNGGKGNDTIKVNGSSTTVKGGAGADVFIFKTGKSGIIADYTEEDKIQFTSGTAEVTTSGDNVIFTVGKGKITLTNAADKTVSYIDDGGNHTYSDNVEPLSFNAKKTAVTLSSSFDENFDATAYSKLVTIDASAATKALDIMGNDNSNSIVGGKKADTIDGGAGDDTLAGGAGADIFLYFDGDGDDVIIDYVASDKIKIIGNSVEPENSGRDVVLKVGTGKITVKNAVRNNIDVTYIENGIECGYIGGERTVSINGAIVTLNDNYRKDIFDISEAKGITKINASDFNRDGLTIKGNAEKNIITSAKGNCTLIGGKGDDTLFGDDGANLYIYSNGDGHDVIQNYGEGDQISIKSGTVSNIVTSGKNVIFTIGKGKISVMGAANKDIYYSVGGKDSIHYADENDTTGNLFASEDDIFFDDSNAQLNSIIKNNSTDYSYSEFSDSTNLIKESNYAFHIAFRGQSV